VEKYDRRAAWIGWFLAVFTVGNWIAFGVMGFVENAPGHEAFTEGLGADTGGVAILVFFSPMLMGIVLGSAALVLAVVIGSFWFPICKLRKYLRERKSETRDEEDIELPTFRSSDSR
jgi:hypothetical protein